MKENIQREVKLKEGITAKIESAVLTIKGPAGEVSRNFLHPKITFAIEGNKIILSSKKATRREKTIIGSFEAHIINMVKGVEELHTYKLKICSGHFPMTVSVSGGELVIKNFLGESVPRKVHLAPGVEVKISGNDITVRGPDKEACGQTAARIENLCRIVKRDCRVFQDGCYIVHKAGKDV